MTVELTRAPAGWGFRPGTVIADLTEYDLPAIPGLASMGSQTRSRAVREALREYPVLPPPWLQRRYGLPYCTAYDIANKLIRGRGMGNVRRAA